MSVMAIEALIAATRNDRYCFIANNCTKRERIMNRLLNWAQNIDRIRPHEPLRCGCLRGKICLSWMASMTLQQRRAHLHKQTTAGDRSAIDEQ